MEIKPWERVDDLQIGGFKLIQDTRGFCFGVDAVLLSDFAKVKKGQRVVDFCTGSGVIPILIAAKTQAKSIIGIEIQPDIANTAQRSVILNNLEERINIIQGDIKDAASLLGHDACEAITCNPPYMHDGGGLINPNDMKAISRHELLCTLEDVCASAAKLLCYGGILYMVHRSDRLTDIINICKSHKLEPKSLRLVYPKPNKNANLLLIAAAYGGRAQLKVLPPLYIHNTDGSYTDEINRIYNRNGGNTNE